MDAPLTNERAQQARKRREELEREQRRADLLAVMRTPAGRRFVWRLLVNAGVFAGSHTGEALSGAYNEGRRAVGIELMTEAQDVAPDEYVMMVAERLEEQRLEAVDRKPA